MRCPGAPWEWSLGGMAAGTLPLVYGNQQAEHPEIKRPLSLRSGGRRKALST